MFYINKVYKSKIKMIMVFYLFYKLLFIGIFFRNLYENKKNN